MIHYHGTPITPDTAALAVLTGGHGLVSFRHQQQMELVAEVASSFVLDNGAFSAWHDGEPVKDWQPYYEWVAAWSRHPGFRWALIPDVIDGDAGDNNRLANEWPLNPVFGVPVWHFHESIQRLTDLARAWPRVALGSSGEYAKVGTTNWWAQMRRAMDAVCDDEGRPVCKLHGLRMLDPRIFKHLPLASADSCNVARNIGLDGRWNGPYAVKSKAVRARILAERIESQQSAPAWTGDDQFELAIVGGM